MIAKPCDARKSAIQRPILPRPPITSALRPLPRPCAATRTCSWVVSEPLDQRLQQRLGQRRRHAERLRILARLEQHLALAAEIARRLPDRALDLGDLPAERLTLGHQLQQFMVDDVEAGAEFGEGLA